MSRFKERIPLIGGQLTIKEGTQRIKQTPKWNKKRKRRKYPNRQGKEEWWPFRTLHCLQKGG